MKKASTTSAHPNNSKNISSISDQTLYNSEHLYQDLVETSQDLIWQCDIKGNYTFLNSAWEEVFGYPLKKMLGRPFTDFQDPEQAAQDIKEFKKLLRGEILKGYQTIHKGKNGKKIHLIFNAKVVTDEKGKIIGTRGTAYDITERVKAEQSLKESEERYRRLSEASFEGIGITRNGKIIDYNDRICAIYGYTREEFSRLSLKDLIYPDDLDLVMSHILQNDPRPYEHRGLAKDKSILFLEIRALSLIVNGEKLRMSIIRDLTERRISEMISEARLSILEYSTHTSIQELLVKTLDEAERLTGSHIGFLHFLEEDQKTLSLQAWSTNTTRSFCHAQGFDRHYPLALAGVWTECIKLRRPVIHNDYASLPNKKGMPKGHAKVIREMVIPVFRNKKIVAILGVGNKTLDYNKQDIDNTSVLADLAWDITSLRLSENKLRQQKVFSEQLIQALPMLFFLFRKKEEYFRLIQWNEQSLNLLNYSIKEMWDKTPQDIFLDNREKSVQEFIQTVENKNKTQFELQLLLKNKETIPCLFNAIKFVDGEQEFLILAGINLSEKLKMMEQVQHIEKMQAIGQLAGGIAHDFNNILSGILGFTELSLLEAENGTVIKDNLEHIKQASERARDLVKQILAYSRKKSENLTSVNLESISQEVIKLLKATIPSSLTLQFECGPSIPPVMADDAKIHEVILNLCTNALHAMTEKGTLTIRLEAFTAQTPFLGILGESPSGLYCRLEVEDNGHGIEKNLLSHIFEPFFTTKSQNQGTGMGLSVVYGIMQSLQGNIQVQSRLNKGSKFSLYFKTIESIANPISKQTYEKAGQKEKVLFVDDETAIVEVSRQILEYLGYQVTAFTSSREALKIFKKNPEIYDLIITDQTMPDLLGLELAAEIRKIKPDIPVILCTGFSYTLSEEEALKKGVNRFCHKPLGMEDLEKVIREVLDQNNKKK